MIPKGLEDGKVFPTVEEMQEMFGEADAIMCERRLTEDEKDAVFHGAIALMIYQMGAREGHFYELLQPYLAELAIRPEEPKPEPKKQKGRSR
jgi:hypothetical protein